MMRSARSGARWVGLGLLGVVLPALMPGVSDAGKDEKISDKEARGAPKELPPPPFITPPAGGGFGLGTTTTGGSFPPGSVPGAGFSGGGFTGGGFPGGGFPSTFTPGGGGFFPGGGGGGRSFSPGGRLSDPLAFSVASFIPEGTAVRDLIPPAPQRLLRGRHLLPQTLSQVQEVALHEYLDKNRDKSLTAIRQSIGKILYMHNKKPDLYMAALVENRSDLSGLPFLLGDPCRKTPDAMMHFSSVLNHVRGSMGGEFSGPLTAEAFARRESNEAISENFWTTFTNNMNAEGRTGLKKTDAHTRNLFHKGQVAALMQVCGPEVGPMKRGMARHLATISVADSSRALARLAVFDPDENVRRDAIEALKVRRDKDFNDILVEGLRYPWPQVAQNAADAIVALERRDLTHLLVNVLAEDDQRLPRSDVVDGKKVHVVREMVKLNHHRNCMLCHVPVNPESPPADVLVGAIAVPGEPLPSFQDGYRNSTPNLAVRIDVTYLRQDFSMFLKVADANPWPEMQRFDFLVRTRMVDQEEVAEYRGLVEPATPGVLNPYHRAAHRALRDLTGRDAEPTADAWRKVLASR